MVNLIELQGMGHALPEQLGMQALVMTSQMKPALHWQATPKKAGMELGTSAVPQATQVWVISFQIEKGELLVEQLQARRLMVALVGHCRHLKLLPMMDPLGQVQLVPVQNKLLSMQLQVEVLFLLRA
jgi:hypothetical protein